jgi:ABC-2 type transport system ATP-binding protein
MIELDQLVKKFGELVAVDHLSLKIEPGEFFAMLGPNAAGKTTTIKLLAGLIKPTAGCARICGFDIQTQPLEARRRLAYVPDFPFLYDKLTAWEFFRFTGEMFQLDAARIRKNAQELVTRFHLEEFADRTLEGLSHGTRQRIAIVSALLHDPEVFVIDEPMVGLDPQHARVVKDVLKERSRAGTTVLVSTHQLSIAEEMADRIGIILGGRLIAVGTREELRKKSGSSGALEEIFLALTAEAK